MQFLIAGAIAELRLLSIAAASVHLKSLTLLSFSLIAAIKNTPNTYEEPPTRVAMSSSSSSQRPDDHRKKWDRAHYERLAQDRARSSKDDAATEPEVKELQLLQRRTYNVDLDSGLGKSVIVQRAANASTSSATASAYYCSICDCDTKDSINFLDHINGTKHQRNLGMSMKVERSTLEQVKQRFAANKQKRELVQKEYDLESRVREANEEMERYKSYAREKKKDRKRKVEPATAAVEEETGGMSAEMAAVMGFSGFGDKKKKK